MAMREGCTTAPSLLSEEDLITAMDSHGIGTDATIPTHIAKILFREYAVKKPQGFEPTQLGLALVEMYDSMNLGVHLDKPNLRYLAL